MMHLFHLNTSFKISVAVEIGLFHPKPFRNCSLFLIITVKLAISRVLLQRPKQIMVQGSIISTIGWVIQEFPVKSLQ